VRRLPNTGVVTKKNRKNIPKKPTARRRMRDLVSNMQSTAACVANVKKQACFCGVTMCSKTKSDNHVGAE